MRYVSLVSAFLAVFAYGSAQATQITNADDEGYAVIVVTTAGEKITKVAAGEIMDDVCPEGCTLILGDKGEVIVTADDSVTIENGTMTLD